ncbi:MAG: hypothetical protein A2812_03145 [Candidatus Staskawiczbacteria bacterium RIFCSPHIGHO2_01_FULL_36_16]|uniref:Uncharacterized protein n=1 Tax=Candidatus Staskawiczbacteria bacterium RIFCSPHIGHO2_01_FULL_36_16 TaxID=1802200 RepID=A0A1G2HR54_9BACT|nr:MAG: hypothetical protein A2812_03145 [Candidatus Staskawiczbacteria bacterium RIFCSPHIGHO2_01_FULL_36_16]
MILTCHIILAAAIAVKIPNAFLAVTLAFLSHYLLDFFPHIEYPIENIKNKQWSKSLPDFLNVFLDFFSGILIILLFLGTQPIIFIAAFFAILPDIMNYFYLIYQNEFLKINHDLHEKIHFLKNKKISELWRITSQALTIIISIILIYL